MKEDQPTEQSFSKTDGSIHDDRSLHAAGGRCRIRAHEKPGGIPVVVASELANTSNTSATSMAKYPAAKIIAKHFPHCDFPLGFGLNSA
jgi:hypothetical protein